MDQNQNLEANQIQGANSSKKEDSATTTSLYNNNQPQQPFKSQRPLPSSPATKKFASVARSFIRAVFCSPVKNEQKSIRKLSNPEAAVEAAADAVAKPPAAQGHCHYQTMVKISSKRSNETWHLQEFEGDKSCQIIALLNVNTAI